jgi:hypothetical protein
MLPSDDKSFIACVQALKRKYYAMSSYTAFAQDNVMAQAPHVANAKRAVD